MLFWLGLIALAICLAASSYWWPTSPWGGLWPYRKMERILAHIKIGMTEREVEQIVGRPPDGIAGEGGAYCWIERSPGEMAGGLDLKWLDYETRTDLSSRTGVYIVIVMDETGRVCEARVRDRRVHVPWFEKFIRQLQF
jgi:hypothetical protein